MHRYRQIRSLQRQCTETPASLNKLVSDHSHREALSSQRQPITMGIETDPFQIAGNSRINTTDPCKDRQTLALLSEITLERQTYLGRNRCHRKQCRLDNEFANRCRNRPVDLQKIAVPERGKTVVPALTTTVGLPPLSP